MKTSFIFLTSWLISSLASSFITGQPHQSFVISGLSIIIIMLGKLLDEGKGNERDISTVIAQFEMVIRKDERQKVLAEVEGWLVDEEVSPIRLTAEAAEIAGKVQSSAEGRNQYRAELRAKLVEMKEGK